MPWAPEQDEVQLVVARLDEALARKSYALWPLLDDEERARARSLLPGPQVEAFVVAHAVLRVALAEALGVDPGAVRLRREPREQPRLAGSAASAIRFSLAYSPTLAVVALARGREVGVDVQEVRPVGAAMDLAARHFLPRDVAALGRAPRERFDREFLQVWARREAALKALGVGLSELLAAHGDASAHRCWPPRTFQHTDLSLGSGHVGALTVERGAGLRISRWEAAAAPGGGALHPLTFVRADPAAGEEAPRDPPPG